MSDRVRRIRGAWILGLFAPLLAALPHETACGASTAAQTPAGVSAAPTFGAPPVAQTSDGNSARPTFGAPPAAPAAAGISSAPTFGTPPAAPAPTGAQTSTDAAAAPSSAGPSESSEDIRDIRGPKFIYPAWVLAAVLAGVALLALGAYGAWRWLRRRARPRALLPFEVTLQQLEEIRALMQPATAREFSIAVSDIVRRYIEQRFDVTATHQTTEEFLRDLLESSNPSLARHRGLLSAFLHQCDLVKFAGMSLSIESMESLHHSARAFVLETVKQDDAPQIRQPLHDSVAKEAHDSLPSA